LLKLSSNVNECKPLASGDPALAASVPRMLQLLAQVAGDDAVKGAAEAEKVRPASAWSVLS